MDDEHREQEKHDPQKEIANKGRVAIGAGQQQNNAAQSSSGGNQPQHKKRITEWFRRKLGDHTPLERLTFAFEVLTFFALCVYSYFSYGQWQEIKKQRDVMNGQLAVGIAGMFQTQQMLSQSIAQTVVAGQSADAAKRAADTASKALDASRDFSRMDQRAWVGIKQFNLISPIAVGKLMTIEIEATNTGKTPALGVTLINCGTGDTEAATLEFACPSGRSGIIAPNGETVFTVEGTDAVSQGYVDRLKAGIQRTFYRFTIKYKDAFGITRYSGVCAYFPMDKTHVFGQCPHGNWMK
jgi:hypothetical protein